MKSFLSKALIIFLTAALVLPLAGCLYNTQSLKIIFPKLGSADSAVILTESATVVIDAGESDDAAEILSLLRAERRQSIDLLIISHYDKDHVGGAADIIGALEVKRVVGSVVKKDSDETGSYYAALEKAGVTEEIFKSDGEISFPDISFKIYPAQGGYTSDEYNNGSTIVELYYGEICMLFTGDALRERLSEFAFEDGKYDLIKIPHHGRESGLAEFYLSSFKEGGYAVITCSDKNPEDENLAALLEEKGINTYLTRNGNIVYKSDGTTSVITQ